MELLAMIDMGFISCSVWFFGSIFIIFFIIGFLLLCLKKIRIPFLVKRKIATPIEPIENDYSGIKNYRTHPNTDQYISENLLSVFIYISKYYIQINNCLSELKKDEIKEIKRKSKWFFEDQEKKWNQLEQVILSNKAENADRTLKKVRWVSRINGILKSSIKNTKKYITKNQDLIPSQHTHLNLLLEDFNQFMNYAIHHQRSPNNNNLEEIVKIYNDIFNRIAKLKNKTLKQVKKQEITAPNSLFYIQFLSDTENILYYILKILTLE
jgi:hypothetical protein